MVLNLLNFSTKGLYSDFTAFLLQSFVILAFHVILQILFEDAEAADYLDEVNLTCQSASSHVKKSISEVTFATTPGLTAPGRMYELQGNRLGVCVQTLGNLSDLIFEAHP